MSANEHPELAVPQRLQPQAILAFVLLVAQPLLSLLYLLSVRRFWLPPTFVVPILLGAFPILAAAMAAPYVRRGTRRTRMMGAIALVLCAVELGWSVLVAAMVGFAIALRSG